MTLDLKKMACYTLQNRRVFPGRLTGGEIFNNRLLFMSLLFSGNFVGDKALMEGDKVVMGIPPSPPLGKTLNREYQNHFFLEQNHTNQTFYGVVDSFSRQLFMLFMVLQKWRSQNYKQKDHVIKVTLLYIFSFFPKIMESN